MRTSIFSEFKFKSISEKGEEGKGNMRKVRGSEGEGGRGHAQEGLHAWLFPHEGPGPGFSLEDGFWVALLMVTWNHFISASFSFSASPVSFWLLS